MKTFELTTVAVTPDNLESDVLFSIPIYQRLFVWGEKEIKQLLKDLWESFCNNNARNKPYYVGIITVVKNGNKWDIIDGQQRLTFLSLFGAWFLRRISVNETKKGITRSDNRGCYCVNCKLLKILCPCYWHRFLYADSKQTELRINYTGRPEDRKDLRLIIDNNVNNVTNPNFRRFLESIEEFSLKINQYDLNDFSWFVFSKTSFLVSELPQYYDTKDLNLFFEKMNSSGRQLSPIEQIKGKFFPAEAEQFDNLLDIEIKKKNESTFRLNNLSSIFNPPPEAFDQIQTLKDEVGSDKWKEIEDAPTSEVRSILKPEVFLLHCLDIAWRRKHLGSEPPFSLDPQKILEVFFANVGSEENQIEPISLLDVMKEYRDWLNSNIIFLYNCHGDSLDYGIQGIEEDDNIESVQKSSFESRTKDLSKKMIQFQSMLYVSSNDWQEWVKKAYLENLQKNDLESLMKIDYRLNDRNREWESILNNPSVLSYPSISRYWFWLLDYIIWEKCCDGIEVSKQLGISIPREYMNSVKKYKFQQNRSREHLHPQTDNPETDSDWMNDYWESFELSSSHELLVQEQYKIKINPKDWFGNLALISTSFNSEQSNESIRVKFAHLKDRLDNKYSLESIKMLLMFLIAGGNENGWSPQNSIEHGKKMYYLLKEYYYRVKSDTL